MGRLCERPGCSAPAGVAYGMDPDRLLVWLDVAPDDTAPLRMGVVCRRHADAMVVPRGWTLDDRREARPRLFRVAERDATSELRRIRRPTRERSAQPRQDDQLSFGAPDTDTDIDGGIGGVGGVGAEHGHGHGDGQDHDVVEIREPDLEAMGLPVTVGDLLPSDSPDSDETQAMPWRPVFDDADDLGGLLTAESPLLSRAFRGVGRDPKSKS